MMNKKCDVLLRACFFMLIFFVGINKVQAQVAAEGKGKLTGKVIDSANGKPLEYAFINLYKKDDTKVFASVVSNVKGHFVIDKIMLGNYRIEVGFVGYKTKNIFNINIAASEIMLGNILLSNKQAANLQEVTVYSKAKVIENKVDRIVYNVANDVTSQGGVALDVLKKVPQVSVDIDGNVELLGSSSIRFLINGKPSTAFGNSIADALAAIPASQIKSIEAITSPGAKYDAEGTGGIINIILKDNNLKGINGSVNLSAGTRLENGAFNFNYKNRNFGVNAFFSGNAQLNSRTLNSQNRLSVDSMGKTSTRILQDGYGDFVRHGYQTGAGFDWAMNKKESITGAFSYMHFDNSSSGATNQQMQTTDFNNNMLGNIFTVRNAHNSSSSQTVGWNVNYKRKFNKEKQELNISAITSLGQNLSDYSQVQNYKTQSSPFVGSTSHNPGINNEFNFSIDYSQPLKNDAAIETGIKYIREHIFSEADVYVLNTANNNFIFDSSQSYKLNYDRKIYAAYVSANFTLLHFLKVNTGLRFEHTNTEIDFPNTAIPVYNSWVPSVMLLHEMANKQTIKLAYTHRIERPDYREINPFKNLSDPYNITAGNPLLMPELGNNFELGYNKSFAKGGNLSISWVERYNTYDIKPYTDFYPKYQIGDSVYQNVSVSTRKNIGKELTSGINVSLSLPVQNKWNIRINTFVSNRHIVNDLSGGNVVNAFGVRTNVNLSYQLQKDFITECFVNYNSPFNNIQGKQPQFLTYTFALRKQFLNKKASFGFTATNPFNEYVKQLSTVGTANYQSTNIRYVPLRSFGISFSYKFGKLQVKKEKEDNGPQIPVEN